MTIALLLAGLALMLLAVAVLSLAADRERARRAAASEFIEQQLGSQWAREEAREAREAGSRLWRVGPQAWSRLLLRAGVAPTPGFYMMLFGVPLGVALLALILAGPLAAGVALTMAVVFAYFRLWLKADRRYRRMVAQLPGFLDSIVRLITIGNSLGSAFQTAVPDVEQPLHEVLASAGSLNRSGKDLDVALRHVSRQYGLHELYLIAAVVGVASRFGGRTDQVLERMAAFMRDLQQAQHELVAMSADIRLSAWVLALLPLGLAGFIVVFNNALFMNMWNDPVGWKLLVGAVVLQAAGCYSLYRMARSV